MTTSLNLNSVKAKLSSYREQFYENMNVFNWYNALYYYETLNTVAAFMCTFIPKNEQDEFIKEFDIADEDYQYVFSHWKELL